MSTAKPARKKPSPEKSLRKNSFASLVKGFSKPAPVSQPASVTTLAPLVHLTYDEEISIKNEALTLFWQQQRLPGGPETITAAPLPRGYRTTSKRRALFRGKKLHLFLGEKIKPLPRKSFYPSPLELAADEQIYLFLQQKLSEPVFHPLAAQLNYLIIRGSMTERVVIFNVAKLDGPLVKKMKSLAVHLQKQLPAVTASFAYLDPTCSDYYLESRRPDRAVSFKKLFGPDKLQVRFCDIRYQFHPTSFSQINEAMVPLMLQQAKELLQPSVRQTLLDLYCGYGLFSLFFAPSVREVLAVDAEGPSIRAAIANSKATDRTGKANCRFVAKRISGSLLEGFAQNFRPNLVILDPPRQGPQDDVIPAIVRRRPDQVLHIFCGVDQIPEALAQWRQGDYTVERVVPLDMFSGTANLEVLVLLRPTSG